MKISYVPVELNGRTIGQGMVSMATTEAPLITGNGVDMNAITDARMAIAADYGQRPGHKATHRYYNLGRYAAKRGKQWFECTADP